MPVRFEGTRSVAAELRYTTRPVSISAGGAITSMATFSVGGWVFLSERNASVADFIWGESDGTTHSVLLQHYNGTLYFRVKNAAGTDTSRNSTSAVIPHRGWYHIGVSYVASSNTLVVTVNGSAVTMSAGTPSGNARTGTRWSFGTVAGAGAAEQFRGGLHRWKCWTTALSASDFLSEFNGTPITAGLAYTFDFEDDFNAVSADGQTTITASVQNGANIAGYRTLFADTADLPNLSMGWAAVYLPENLIGPSGGSMTGWLDYHGFDGSIDTANTVAPLIEDGLCRCATTDITWASTSTLVAWGMETNASSSAYDGPTLDRQNFTVCGVFASNGRQSATGGTKFPLLSVGSSETLTVYIDCDTNKIGLFDGTNYRLTTLVAPTTPFFLSASGNASGVTLTLDELSDTTAAMASGIAGTGASLAAANILYLLQFAAGGRGAGTVYAMAFRNRTSTAAEIAAIRSTMMERCGLRTTANKMVMVFFGDSRNVNYPLRGRTYAGIMAQRYFQDGLVVYNMGYPGRTIVSAAAATSEITDTQILGRASRRILVVNLGGNETSWRTSSAFQTDGETAWSSLVAGVFGGAGVAAAYTTRVFQTLIGRGSGGSASNDENTHKVTWYYNQAARANTSGILVADVANVWSLIPAGQDNADNFDAAVPTTTQAQIQAAFVAPHYEATSSSPYLHLADSGFEQGADITERAMESVLGSLASSINVIRPRNRGRFS